MAPWAGLSNRPAGPFPAAQAGPAGHTAQAGAGGRARDPRLRGASSWKEAGLTSTQHPPPALASPTQEKSQHSASEWEPRGQQGREAGEHRLPGPGADLTATHGHRVTLGNGRGQCGVLSQDMSQLLQALEIRKFSGSVWWPAWLFLKFHLALDSRARHSSTAHAPSPPALHSGQA